VRGDKGARDIVTKRRRGKEGVELRAVLGKYFRRSPRVPLLMGLVYLLIQYRFEEPVRPWLT